MADDDNQPIRLADFQLRRNVIASHRLIPSQQRQPDKIDFWTSNLVQFFSPLLPLGPRRIMQSEVWYTTTALDGSASYLASPAFLQWQAVLPPRQRPTLTLSVFDCERERTAPSSQLRLV